MTTKRLTLAQAETVSTLLNSTVAHHTEGKKVLTISAFANDEQSQAGIQIKKTNSDKQLVVMGVDFSKQSVIIATGSDMAKRALQALLEENHSSVFSSVKNQHIPIAAYVAWEIVTDGNLIDSLIDLYEGHTLKAGQKYLKQIPSSAFDECVAQALTYLDLDDVALSKIGWLSERQVKLYRDKITAIDANVSNTVNYTKVKLPVAWLTSRKRFSSSKVKRFMLFIHERWNKEHELASIADDTTTPVEANADVTSSTEVTPIESVSPDGTVTESLVDKVTVTAIDGDGNTISVQVPKAKKSK